MNAIHPSEPSADTPTEESIEPLETVGTVVVTGASTGIGYATARLLAARRYRVIATVRTEEDAQHLRESLGPLVEPVLVDVLEEDQIAALAHRAQEIAGPQGLAGLVNNAGIAIAAPIMHIDLDDLRYQFDVNVVGLVAVTQALLPLLGARRDAPQPPGRIINISSVSGHIVYPFMGAYAASKHALEALTDAMRRELLMYGIPVIGMTLGAVNTPIWQKSENQDIERYLETDYGESLRRLVTSLRRMSEDVMPVERVAALIYQALTSAKPRSRYVLANNWFAGWILPRLAPSSFFDWAVARQLGLDRLP